MPAPARVPSAEDGLTLIEVIIGMAVTVVVVGAIAMAMVLNNHSALGVQRQTQLLAVLQNRIEYVHQVLAETYASKGFAAISLSSNPAKPTDSSLPNDPGDPNDFITEWEAAFNTASGGEEEFRIEKNYNNTSQGAEEGVEGGKELLQVDTTNGKIAPVVYVDLSSGETSTSPASLPPGHLYATVNTYVTLTKALPASAKGSCNTNNGTGSNASDVRRVIVAARLSAPGRTDVGSLSPQYATTLLANPIPANQCQGSSAFDIMREIP